MKIWKLFIWFLTFNMLGFVFGAVVMGSDVVWLNFVFSVVSNIAAIIVAVKLYERWQGRES